MCFPLWRLANAISGRTGGPINPKLAVNLKQKFGLTNLLSDHGAQFDRAIQYIHGYYSVLLEALGVPSTRVDLQ